MEFKNNQKILNGFEKLARSQQLYDIVSKLISDRGVATLAEEVGIDKSAISRFKNGDGALPLKDIQKFFEIADIIVIPTERFRRLVSNIISMAELLKESLGW